MLALKYRNACFGIGLHEYSKKNFIESSAGRKVELLFRLPLNQNALNEEKIKEREYEIIQYIKKNPNCTLDSIYTKGRISKSKVTKELFEKLLREGKIHAREPNKKKFYVEEEQDWVKELGNIAKDMEEDMKIYSQYDNELSRKYLEFLKQRIKVLTAEGKKSNDVDIRNTLKIIGLGLEYSKNPNAFTQFIFLDALYWAIEDDKYYLTHQLHSNPTDKKRKFHKVTIGKRRSIEDLLEMKKKGAREYGLTGKDFRKNMKKLTNDPNVWSDRFFAERNRTFYNNSPELRDKIFKKILDTTKLTPDMPNYEKEKKLLDAQKEAFPNMPISVIYETMSEEDREKFRRDFEEMGGNFELFDEMMRNTKTNADFSSNSSD